MRCRCRSLRATRWSDRAEGLPDSNLSDSRAIEVVKAVDVVLDARLVSLDGGDDEQVLQVVVVGEGGVLQHDLLQELDQLVLELGLHEGLDRH